MKKFTYISLCLIVMFSCSNKKRENINSLKNCSITDNIWIADSNLLYIFHRDYLPVSWSVGDGLYLGLRFLKNGNIKLYKCGKSFINTSDDIKKENHVAWGLNKFILNDTCCYPEELWSAYWNLPIPEQFNNDSSERSISWKRINDNEFSLIFPKNLETDFPMNIGGHPNRLNKTEVPENVNFELLDYNTLKFNNYNILNLLSDGFNLWFDSTNIDVKFNRTPRINHK